MVLVVEESMHENREYWTIWCREWETSLGIWEAKLYLSNSVGHKGHWSKGTLELL